MKLYRVCSYKYLHDLSGEGASINGGRWNSAGRVALYTSESKSLAVLEVLANTPLAILRADFSVITLELTGSFSTDEYTLKDLPAGWNTYPVPVAVARMGDRWLRAGNSLLLKVPSAILPSECNVIINPAHPDFNKVKITDTEKLAIDKRIEENLR
ncbi:MAG TPA: RES family NAD+ phosphorylase [Agriterribacter sp.]|nr:RES family NAD+ phosphorylase [Agriterribacter sp.]HRQ50737.1 RES family NAD+ phosphorylase [Agriterribacter sp.]